MPFAGHFGEPKLRVREDRTSRAAAEAVVMRGVRVRARVSSFMVGNGLLPTRRDYEGGKGIL